MRDPERPEATRAQLRELFERGEVYADRFPPHVRDALDVPDPLTDIVVAALAARTSVVISGNAGDGKSHLAQRALDHLPGRSCIEVTTDTTLPSELPRDAVVFVRDASGLTNDQVLGAVAKARQAGSPVLLTINEGPLNSLAANEPDRFFSDVRNVLHSRALGLPVADPHGLLVLSLSGRQLTKSAFVEGALDRLLPVVAPCRTCGTSRDCPRIVGARMLRKSKRAKERLCLLLQLLTNRGRHLSAREIWLFLIDLFFGWTCSVAADDIARADGLFWMRVFAGTNRVGSEIALEFDPINAPMAQEDVLLWQGRFAEVAFDQQFPGAMPSSVARTSRDDGLRAFASAKRAYFFFSRDIDANRLMARQSSAPQFGALLATAPGDPRRAIREIVGLINQYRLEAKTENDLWISRHHSLAAHRRPSVLAASSKLPIETLGIRVPFASEVSKYPEAGFFPDQLLLHWQSSEQMLTVSFDTWERLSEERSLTVDRDQESLDLALDLFMSQADVPPLEDPEIHVYDHDRREGIVIRVKPAERKIEAL